MPFLQTPTARIHYLVHPGDGPLLILMHGLTANAHAFDGLLEAGLGAHFNIVSVDLRGRGLSEHPALHYTMEDHAQDILALLRQLQKHSAVLCGHSFGGLLGMYLAAHYPETVERLVVLDAAARMNPKAAEMLAFRLGTLDLRFPSFDDYLKEVKAAPYNTFWSDAMLSYYTADTRAHDKGGVTPRPQLANIIQASMGVGAIDWPALLERIKAPVLLINAPEAYALGEPLLPPHFAQETADKLADARLITVAGNHQTMLYGEGAGEISDAIVAFAG